MIEGSIFADELPEPPTGVQTMTEWLRALLRSDDVYEAMLGQPNPQSTFERVGDGVSEIKGGSESDQSPNRVHTTPPVMLCAGWKTET